MSKTITLSDETTSQYASGNPTGDAYNEVKEACEKAMIPEAPDQYHINCIRHDLLDGYTATWIEYVLKNGYTP